MQKALVLHVMVLVEVVPVISLLGIPFIWLASGCLILVLGSFSSQWARPKAAKDERPKDSLAFPLSYPDSYTSSEPVLSGIFHLSEWLVSRLLVVSLQSFNTWLQ